MDHRPMLFVHRESCVARLDTVPDLPIIGGRSLDRLHGNANGG